MQKKYLVRLISCPGIIVIEKNAAQKRECTSFIPRSLPYN